MSGGDVLRDETLITYDGAVARLAAMARPLEQVDCPLNDASGLVTAADVLARHSAPRRNVSIMDGYAIRSRDLPGPFAVNGTSAAGMANPPSVGEGGAVRIYTGAPVPADADRVVVQEITRTEGDRMTVTGDVGDNPFIRRTGCDFEAGAVLLPENTRLTPNRLVTAAAADRATIRVWRKARVAILATGDELVEPGQATRHEGAIPDSISCALAAACHNWGGEVVARRRVPDNASTIEGEASALLRTADILVVIGGASVGARDFAKHALAGGEFHEVFSKVAMQPGKPVWCAASDRGQFVVGLPGNPVSAMVTARLFLAPLIAASAGRPFGSALPWEPLAIVGAGIHGRWREQFARGTRENGSVRLIENQLSSAQIGLAITDTLVRVPASDQYYGEGASMSCLWL
ncbi:MAG: molybdopterin molybdotransferase MoeA [Pontixanthobacter sp.]